MVSYQYDSLQGLWMGLDPMGFQYLYAFNTLGLLSASGAFVWNGRYVAGAVAQMWEPQLTFSSDRASVSVVVLGADGSTAAFPTMSASNYVSHIWVTDQNDAVLCETSFPPPKAEGSPCSNFDEAYVCKDDMLSAPTLIDCVLPATTTSVQAHQYCTGHGLWSSAAAVSQGEVGEEGGEEGGSGASDAVDGDSEGAPIGAIIGGIIAVLACVAVVAIVKKKKDGGAGANDRASSAHANPAYEGSCKSAVTGNPVYLPGVATTGNDGYLDVEAAK